MLGLDIKEIVCFYCHILMKKKKKVKLSRFIFLFCPQRIYLNLPYIGLFSLPEVLAK